MMRNRLIIGLLVAVVGCDAAPKAARPKAAASAAIPGNRGVREGAGNGAAAQKAVEFEDSDFIEGLNNRDPFRSYTAEFLTPEHRTAKIQRKVILERYGLDELRLIGVVTGGTRSRAMFRDPSGLGVAVKNGDYIGKNASRVKQILADRVILQLEEHLEEGQRMADRVILLQPESKEALDETANDEEESR